MGNKRYWTDERMEILRAALAEGGTGRDVTERVSIALGRKLTRNAVIGVLNRRKIPLPRGFTYEGQERPLYRGKDVPAWSKEEKRKLRECVALKMSRDETAKVIGRTAESVAKMAQRLKIRFKSPGDSWKEDDVKGLRDCAVLGLTQRETAQKIGRSINAVERKASRLGVEFIGNVVVAEFVKPPEPEMDLPDTVTAIAAIEYGSCRWPIGDPLKPGFRFCGCEARLGRPYCAEHMAVAYVGKPSGGKLFVPKAFFKAGATHANKARNAGPGSHGPDPRGASRKKVAS